MFGILNQLSLSLSLSLSPPISCNSTEVLVCEHNFPSCNGILWDPDLSDRFLSLNKCSLPKVHCGRSRCQADFRASLQTYFIDQHKRIHAFIYITDKIIFQHL